MFKDKQENLSLPLVENSFFPQREVTKKPDQKCWNLKLQEREYYLQIKVFYSRKFIPFDICLAVLLVYCQRLTNIVYGNFL